MSETLKFGNGQWAVKEGSTLAYNSENGNFKPLPFTFDRSTSATRVNKEGLIEVVSNNEPRIDFLNDSNGALLLEPSRSNVFLNSNKFDTTWQGNYTVLTSGQVGVGGSTDAWMLSGFAGTSQEKRIRQYPPSPGIYAVSVYAKAGTVDYLWLRGVTNSANKRTFFNLSTGQIGLDGAVSSSMIDMGDGWYRCEAVFNQQSGFEFYIGLSDTENAATSTTGNIYIQYAQAEQGSYSTSYIPTQGSIGTRDAETCEQTPLDGIIGQTEGTVYVEVDWKGNDEESIFGVLHDGTVNNRMDFGYSDFFNSFYFNIRTNGSSQGLMQYANPIIGKYKIAISYKNNDFALWVNGVKEAFDNSGSVPITTKYNVGNYIGGGREYPIMSSKIYNTALTDQELINLTKI